MNKDQETNKEQDIFYKMVEKAREVKLTEREKTALFAHVDSYIRRNPLESESKVQVENKVLRIKNPVKSPFWDNAASLTKKTFEISAKKISAIHDEYRGLGRMTFHNSGFRVAAAFALILVIGGSTSLAAQGALPGDFLYPVKVGFNEEIKSVFLFGRSDVEYQVERTKNRINEVKKLAEQNRLSDEVSVRAASRIDSQISKVTKDLDNLANKGDLKTVYEITSELEKALRQTDGEITRLAVEKNSDPQTLSAKRITRDLKAKTVETRLSVEEKIFTSQKTDEEMKSIAMAKYETVKSALADIEAASLTEISIIEEVSVSAILTDEVAVGSTTLLMADEPEAVDIEITTMTEKPIDPLTQAKELFSLGEEKLNNGEYNEAFKLLRDAGAILDTLNTETEILQEEKERQVKDETDAELAKEVEKAEEPNFLLVENKKTAE